MVYLNQTKSLIKSRVSMGLKFQSLNLYFMVTPKIHSKHNSNKFQTNSNRPYALDTFQIRWRKRLRRNIFKLVWKVREWMEVRYERESEEIEG